MNNQPRILKTLPYTPKKGKIYEMYAKQLSIATMKEKLNELRQIDCNKTGIKYVEGGRHTTRKVWVEWVKIFGFPENYEQDPNILNENSLD